MRVDFYASDFGGPPPKLWPLWKRILFWPWMKLAERKLNRALQKVWDDAKT